jgi:glycine cleavage system aminomethyltransferase T
MITTDLPAQLAAIRTATALARPGHTHVVRITGRDAQSAAQWLLPSRLYLRDAQARQSLLLDERGRPIADVLVAADDMDYLLLIEGPTDPLPHLRANLRGDAQLEVLDSTHEVIELHGPWAWELLAQVLGEDLVALPYLNFFRIDEGLCVRAGRTGEFGYQVIVARSEAQAVVDRFIARGPEFDLLEVSAEALSLASFENWFFDPSHVAPEATAVELSLSWRLAHDRDFLGRNALVARRASRSVAQACVLADDELHDGDRVQLGGRAVGRITRAAVSPTRQRWFGSALVETRLAFAGIDLETERGTPLHTIAPPLIDNQSLYVDPRRHAYRARHEVPFGGAVAETTTHTRLALR